MLDNVIPIAKKICREKHPEAKVALLAGSIVRGEGTAHSDLDLVVVYDHLPSAYVETFYRQSYPVEAFVHDPETLRYFIERDIPSGICVMAQMVAEGIELTEPNALSKSLKEFARSVVEGPPPELNKEALAGMRYRITNLVDDIRAPRCQHELVACGTLLYEALANCYLRTNNHWAARGKMLPRKLALADAGFCDRFCEGFQKLFADGQTGEVIALAGEVLQPIGGFVFDGYRRNALAEQRRVVVKAPDTSRYGKR